MREATEFQELRSNYETEIGNRKRSMTEEDIVFNNKLPDYGSTSDDMSIAEQDDYSTTSIYLAPDYSVVVDSYAEFLLQRFPTLQFEANKDIIKNEDYEALNDVVKIMMASNKLNYKLASVMRAGLRKGFCVCEVVPISKKTIGQKLVIDKDGNESWEDIIRETKGLIDIIKYDPSTTYVDPNADPDNPRDTAAFVIVKVGTYTKTRFIEIAKDKGWKDVDKIQEQYINTGEDLDYTYAKVLEGIDSQKGITIHKLYKSNGMVQTIANSTYIVHEGINSKHIQRMPLIFYTSIAGGSTPYGRMLWDMMRQSVLGKSACLNLALDNIGKNMKSPIFTNIADLAHTNLNELQKDGLIHVSTQNYDRPLSQSFHKIEFPDMTPGIQSVIQMFNQDAREISRQDSLSSGLPQHQIRTNAIAEQMSSPSRDKKSNYIKQAEYTLIDYFGEDLIWILASRYPEYEEVKNIDREKLFDIKAVRTRNGSTLEEDQMTQLQRMMQFFQIIQAVGDDAYDTDKVIEMIGTSMGITNIQELKLPIETMMMKARIKQGIPMDNQGAMPQ